MVNDVIVETNAPHASGEAEGFSSPEAVRGHWRAAVDRVSQRDIHEDLARLRAFLQERMYRHFRVNRSRSASRRIGCSARCFTLFMAEPEVLPGRMVPQRRHR